MSDKPKTRRGWRILRRILIGLAILATLVAALVTEENWRGKRAWENYKHDSEARGEKLDWQSFVPPSVPDDQNFFTAPMMAQIFFSNGDVFNIYRGNSKFWPEYGGNWQKATLTDLTEWQIYFRNFNASSEGRTNGFLVPARPQTPAADVLMALSVFDSDLEALRAASQRPGARAPFSYENGFQDIGNLSASLGAEKRVAQFLRLRVLAELQAGQSDAALTDARVFLRLIDSMQNQPLLITHLVRIAIQAITIQPIYEGLAQHRWNDAQLASLEAALAEQDYLADFEFAMRGEQAFAIASLENQRRTGEVVMPLENGGSMTLKMTWMPSAYFYQNELAIARMHQDWILPLVDTNSRIVSPQTNRRMAENVHTMTNHYSPYKIQAMLLAPAIGYAAKKFAIAQADVDLARVACALERYRLAHGEYPESLDALAPQFIEKLPHDIINGQPLHYRRTDDGKFTLYSVGWNEKDDGGTVVLRKGSSVVDMDQGDWVWKY